MLVSAKTEAEFLDIVYRNFNWVNEMIDNFKPKFKYSDDFKNGVARVQLCRKYG
jgi:hypothetical protein